MSTISSFLGANHTLLADGNESPCFAITLEFSWIRRHQHRRKAWFSFKKRRGVVERKVASIISVGLGLVSCKDSPAAVSGAVWRFAVEVANRRTIDHDAIAHGDVPDQDGWHDLWVMMVIAWHSAAVCVCDA